MFRDDTFARGRTCAGPGSGSRAASRARTQRTWVSNGIVAALMLVLATGPAAATVVIDAVHPIYATPTPRGSEADRGSTSTGQADYENAHNYPAEYSALGAGTDAAHHTYATPTPRARAGSVYNGFGEKNQGQAVDNSQC